ncbi:MAG TPA: CvpA family protein, partial [Candidatus Saccharimonadales bacterium]|nr:CvpA family protein [Candidatus Saccharimonadales bacterium]
MFNLLNSLGINLLDVIIVIIILFYAHEGYTLGFTLAVVDLASFVLAFIIALKSYSFVAKILINLFSMPLGFANAAGFLLVAFVSEIALSILLRKLLNRIPAVSHEQAIYKVFKQIDNWLGLIPGAISAFIVVSFILSVIVSLPSSPLVKGLVTDSKIGSRLISNTSFLEKKLNDVFGGALNETLNFMTVEPQSNELVELHFKIQNGTTDSKAEQDMFKAVNTERAKAGVALLAFDYNLRDVARAHSQDMFERGYFSHYTPEGLSPFDRMEKAGIEFNFA